MFVVFLGNTLKENKVLSLMKVPQWCVFTRSMDAATQMLDCDETITKFGVQDLKECENSHTLTTTTTESKNSKKANNQTDNQNSVLCPPKVLSLQILGLG